MLYPLSGKHEFHALHTIWERLPFAARHRVLCNWVLATSWCWGEGGILTHVVSLAMQKDMPSSPQVQASGYNLPAD